jgi:hypothetical protein
MVGDDPERLVSDLQNQFPNEAIEVNENYDAGLVAKVMDLIELRGKPGLSGRGRIARTPKASFGPIEVSVAARCTGE